MLKKMRRRFIAAAMAAFAAVILTLLCVINLWNRSDIVRQQDETLQRIADMETNTLRPQQKDLLPLPGGDRYSLEVQYMLRFFSVACTGDGHIYSVNQDFIASISRQDAERYTAAVLAKGHQRGYYNGYRYLKTTYGDGGYRLVFLNAEREIQSMNDLLMLTIGIAFGCLLVVFLLVLLFSRHAIAPYQKNLEAQKQFITNASHELKTPLTAIATSADVLEMELTDNEWVQNIQRQSAKLSRLISDLVTLSRLNEENPFPDKAQFSLSDVVWEAAEPFASLSRARGKLYSQQIGDDITASGDRHAVQQMVSILLDNAVKYCSEGGDISLLLTRQGNRSLLEISNSCQLPAGTDISRLFDRFYRADASRSGKISGSGIGLAIARATVEAHGGSIQVQQNGNRITFRVRLP